MKKLLSLLLLFAMSFSLSAQEQLWKPGYDGSFDNWSGGLPGGWTKVNNQSGHPISVAAVADRFGNPGKALEATVTIYSGWLTWHNSVRSPDGALDIKDGEEFYYTFWAKGSKNGLRLYASTPQIYDGNHGGAGWENTPYVVLTTEWKQYGIVDKANYDLTHFAFHFRDMGRDDKYYIDDLQIYAGNELPPLNQIVVSDNKNISLLDNCPECDVIVEKDKVLTVNEDRNFNSVTLKPGARLTVTDDYQLTAPLKLESNETDGTATLVGHVPGEVTMEQYIGSSRSWYMGIPFSSFAFSDGDVKGYDVFTESSRSWNYQLGSPTNAQAGYGMMINPNDGVEKLTLSGEVISGDVVLNGMTSDQERFHFVGNPYPSFMKWSELGRENLDETIWFRTSLDGSLDFATLSGSVSSPEGIVDDNLAPMQGFWVRVEKGKKGKLTFPNAQRTHYEGGLKQLRAPQQGQEEMQIVRLTVTDGTLKDETVIYFDEANSNGRDRLDATKMMSGNRAQIYTQLDGEAIVINAMESIPFNSELPLGFRTPKAGEFTLYANQFQGFEEGLKLILTDHISGNEVDLVKSDYTFTASEGNNIDRFSIRFVPATPTDNISTAAGQELQLTVNSERQIVLNLAQNPQNATAKVYTVSGQQIASTVLHAKRSVLSTRFDRGVYIVVVDNNGVRSTERIVIN